MSLTRRKIISWVLVLLAALSWTAGQRLLRQTEGSMDGTVASTLESTLVSVTADTEPVEPADPLPTDPSGSSGEAPGTFRQQPLTGYLLSCAAAVLVLAAVLFFSRREPLLGPDGTALVGMLVGLIRQDLLTDTSRLDVLLYFVISAAVILSLLELWGWIRSGCRLSWCALQRIVKRCPSELSALLCLAGGVTGLSLGAGGFLLWALPGRYPISCGCLLIALGLAVGCLIRYGLDLHHLSRQLRALRNGVPMEVRPGAFEAEEAGLLALQEAHEEAVRTAVISERYKVDLIANVSHDLRTPLTAILGYSELLESQPLSPEGREQLRQLNRKAGYMRDLVESLFELTKVSSGAAECKKERIDLIRLLEQTIGLFDDQLTAASLQVRRHYRGETMPVITDGARMHQVFANLLGNAIKYALPGTRIHLEVGSDGESCTVRMVNTASYEMDFQPEEVLQRFARGDKARSTQGSGLGLAIAQTYTESVGGTFRITIDGDQFSAIVTLPEN